jgi:hypothetical protein
MVSIRGKVGEFTLDLNESCKEVHDFRVVSLDSNGNPVYWVVDYISCGAIRASKKGDTMVSISVDIDNILKNEYLYLVNAKNESLLILVVPNKEATAPKHYVFEADASVIGGNILVSIESTVNDNDAPWVCSYDGKPLNLHIDPKSGNGPSEVTMSPRSRLYSAASTVVDFTQEKSGKQIRVYLSFSVDGTPTVKDVVCVG